MKLIPKGSSGAGQGGDLIPDPILAALVRWYSGNGDKNDEAVGVALVQNARRNRLWFACDCLVDNKTRPVISPALLTLAETYYLRRLSGQSRAQHDSLCPFHRAQVMSDSPVVIGAPKPVTPPVGYFSVLKPEPEKLAQKPDNAAPDAARSASVPMLARLMWWLMERAGTNRIALGNVNRPSSILDEFAALKRAAATIEIAPRITLDSAFYTHAAPYHSGALYARLRASAARWPRAHAPQAFMLLYAYEIDGETIHLASGDPITLATRVQSPRTRLNPVSGPFLVLVVVGSHPDVHGYAAIAGYAQPVHSGRHFIAVETNSQRSVVDALIGIGTRLCDQGQYFGLTRPLFDFATPDGLVRPDFLVACTNGDGAHVDPVSIMVEESAAVPKLDISEALLCYAPLIITDAVAARNGRLAGQFGLKPCATTPRS